jgi:hypothetical protein
MQRGHAIDLHDGQADEAEISACSIVSISLGLRVHKRASCHSSTANVDVRQAGAGGDRDSVGIDAANPADEQASPSPSPYVAIAIHILGATGTADDGAHLPRQLSAEEDSRASSEKERLTRTRWAAKLCVGRGGGVMNLHCARHFRIVRAWTAASIVPECMLGELKDSKADDDFSRREQLDLIGRWLL